jgi:hypothetical protein
LFGQLDIPVFGAPEGGHLVELETGAARAGDLVAQLAALEALDLGVDGIAVGMDEKFLRRERLPPLPVTTLGL